jgi:ubiquinone/menaquinone biosynthesis C-methylase UbiE
VLGTDLPTLTMKAISPTWGWDHAGTMCMGDASNQFTGGIVASDLNKNPRLPFPDKSFDVVTCVVSVDYLNKPLDVFKEVARVLKPGGRFIISQSNRVFFTKAVSRWLALSERGRLQLIWEYFHYSQAGFGTPRAFDISATGKGADDPMYIVEATKERQ